MSPTVTQWYQQTAISNTHTHTEYRDAFALFDKRGDGKIDSDQVGDVLRALNLNPTEVEVKKIVQEIDPNGRSKRGKGTTRAWEMVESEHNYTHP